LVFAISTSLSIILRSRCERPGTGRPGRVARRTTTFRRARRAKRLSVLGPCGCRATATIGTPLRCEQADQESISVLAHGDLDIGIGGNAQEALSDRDRLLVRVQADLENLLGSFELTDQFLELTLLLLAFSCRRAQLAGPLTSFVHQGRIGLPNCDHLVPLLRAQDGNVIDRPKYGH
jgi:hypothetical protein